MATSRRNKPRKVAQVVVRFSDGILGSSHVVVNRYVKETWREAAIRQCPMGRGYIDGNGRVTKDRAKVISEDFINFSLYLHEDVAAWAVVRKYGGGKVVSLEKFK